MKVALHKPTKVSLKDRRKSIGKRKEVYWTVPSGEKDEQKPLALSFKNLIEEKKKSIEDKEVAAKTDGMCQWLNED